MNHQVTMAPGRKLRGRVWQTTIVLLMIASFESAVETHAADADWGQRARQVAQRRLQTFGTSGPATHVASDAVVEDTLVFRLAADGTSPGGDGPNAGARSSPPASAPTEEESPAIERGPLPGFFETVERDIKEAPELLWHDTKKVFGNPGNLIFLVGAGGASLALRPEVDDDIEDYYDRHHSFKEDWRDAFGAAGNPATHFGFALLWYAVGQQTQDIKTYEVGKRAISALAITGATTMMLKICANTESPNGENLGWPSGHVSSTMALATVLNDAYGPLVGVPLFGLTGLVAVERLDDGEHHFSDVVFGAALGWVVAETVMKEHRPEIFGGQIVPYADPANGNAGVAWVKTLGQ